MVTGLDWDINIMKPIKYVKHPISDEEKKAIMADGIKIVDTIFAPTEEVEEEKPAKRKPAKAKA
jgi:hypothetical protein